MQGRFFADVFQEGVWRELLQMGFHWQVLRPLHDVLVELIIECMSCVMWCAGMARGTE